VKLVITAVIDGFPDDDGFIPGAIELVPQWSTTEERYAWQGVTVSVQAEDQPAEGEYTAFYTGDWPGTELTPEAKAFEEMGWRMHGDERD
jgi:hypothetical protein